MNYKEKKKKLAKERKIRKYMKELELIGMGAGVWWQPDGYFEFRDDYGKCLGAFMEAVREQYGLDRTDLMFSFYRFREWDDLRTLAKLLLNQLEIVAEREK